MFSRWLTIHHNGCLSGKQLLWKMSCCAWVPEWWGHHTVSTSEISGSMNVDIRDNLAKCLLSWKLLCSFLVDYTPNAVIQILSVTVKTCLSGNTMRIFLSFSINTHSLARSSPNLNSENKGNGRCCCCFCFFAVQRMFCFNTIAQTLHLFSNGNYNFTPFKSKRSYLKSHLICKYGSKYTWKVLVIKSHWIHGIRSSDWKKNGIFLLVTRNLTNLFINLTNNIINNICLFTVY